MKFCKDCKYFKQGFFSEKCCHPKNKRYELVYGTFVGYGSHPNSMREYDYGCGENGAWFAPKDPAQ